MFLPINSPTGLLSNSPTYSKATDVITPNIVIAIISSKLDAAIRVVGIPFATPNPFLWRIIKDGTSTAGDTAPIQNPKAIAIVQGIEKNHLPIRPTTTASDT